MACLSLSAINTIISLAIVFGFISIKDLRDAIKKISKKHPWIWFLIIILILNGSINIQMICTT